MSLPRALPTPCPRPDFARLLGRSVHRAVPLLDYGYRAAWRVEAGDGAFIVKADMRPGFAAREYADTLRAARAGIPVAEAVAVAGGAVPSFALRWVEGVALHDLRTPGAWRSAGEVLRRIHDLPHATGADEPWSVTTLAWLEGNIDHLVDNQGLSPRDRDAALARARDLQPLIDDAALAWIHGDCQEAHFLLDPSTAVVSAVLDWAEPRPGLPDMDFAVLTIDSEDGLGPLLDGYGANAALRERLRVTLPYHRAVRGALAAPWLDAHGYPGVAWPLEAVRAFAKG